MDIGQIAAIAALLMILALAVWLSGPTRGAPRFYFRGTTYGWAGGYGAQTLPRTSTSTDPRIATLFAAEGRHKGTPIVVVVASSAMVGREIDSDGNYFRELEREVAFVMVPADFELHAMMTVHVDACVAVLNEMGFEVAFPPDTTLMDQELKRIRSDDGYLTPRQIDAFVKRLKKRSDR